jgi:hypothetical protein
MVKMFKGEKKKKRFVDLQEIDGRATLVIVDEAGTKVRGGNLATFDADGSLRLWGLVSDEDAEIAGVKLNSTGRLSICNT